MEAHVDEKRIARDGWPYTRLEFIEHYGRDWRAHWEEASIATAGAAPQPAAAQPAAVEPIAAADRAVPQLAVENIGRGGVEQPAVVEPSTAAGSAVPQPARIWSDTPYHLRVLPMQSQELARVFPAHPYYNSARDALNGACALLYNFLPLLATDFTNFDLARTLGEPGSVVVAEAVVRVRDANRPPTNRVDFRVQKQRRGCAASSGPRARGRHGPSRHVHQQRFIPLV